MRKTFTLFFLAIFGISAQAQNLFDISTLQDIRIVFARSDWDFMLDSMAQAGDNYSIASSVTINGTTFNNVGVKYKGNSTYNPNNLKNSLAVKLDYLQTQDYQGYTSLKLNNAFKDPSFVREVMGYEIARKYMPSVEANYANVYVNGNLHGVYSNIQDLNKSFLSNHFAGKNGPFFKCDPIMGLPPTPGCNPGGSTLEYLGADTACYYNKYENQNTTGWTELKDLTFTLNNNTGAIESILDVDRALWMLAYNNVFCNFDSYTGSGHNYYVYKDENQKFSTLLWDLNETFGNFTNGGQGNLTLAQLQTLSPLHNNTQINRPLLYRLLSNPRYKKSYIAHLRTILAENVTNDWYYTRAQQLQAIINTAVSADPNKLYTYTQFQQNLTTSFGTMWGLRSLMESRDSFLLQHVEITYTKPTISNIQAPSSPLAGSSVTITATVSNGNNVRLRHRSALFDIFQDDPMFDDGAHADGAAGDGVYGASLLMNSPQKQYYIYAENANAAMFSPERAEYEFYSLQTATAVSVGDVVINEFMAADSTAVADQNGEFDDWIELFNTTNQPISLNGFYLSDNFGNPQKWQFPDTTIAANGYLIIWADNDSSQAGLHAYFKLSASGEEIMLSANNGTVLDSVSYGAQNTDVSMSRIPNGTGNFVATTQFTFAANNDNTAVESLHSDWLPSLRLYPNPNNIGLVNLQFESPLNADFQYELIDNLGRSLLQKQLSNVQGTIVEQIVTNHLPAGTYFIRVIGGKQNQVLKLVVQ